jgi:predicted AlkP superfamily phosphohydrolase/phosphomutase
MQQISTPQQTEAPSPRLLVIGLDCAAPELLFEAWRSQLPTIDELMRRGVYGRIESCIPAITVPAWSCMMSSHDPGQLGIYSFRNRVDYSYESMVTATARSITVPRICDVLGAAGKRVGLVGVPQTYPVAPVSGELVSCFLTPSQRSAFTYPPELKQEIAGWVEGEFLMDVPNFRTDDKNILLHDIYRMADQHFSVCKRLLERQQYDLFITVDMGVDRIHHGFWKEIDARHPHYRPGSPSANAIREYYRYINDVAPTLLSLLDQPVPPSMIGTPRAL